MLLAEDGIVENVDVYRAGDGLLLLLVVCSFSQPQIPMDVLGVRSLSRMSPVFANIIMPDNFRIPEHLPGAYQDTTKKCAS